MAEFFTPKMTMFLMKSLAYGLDKLPDKTFEKVPGQYYKEKGRRDYENERHRGHSARHDRRTRSLPDDSDGSDFEDMRDEDLSKRGRRGPRRSSIQIDRTKERPRSLTDDELKNSPRSNEFSSRSSPRVDHPPEHKPYNPADYVHQNHGIGATNNGPGGYATSHEYYATHPANNMPPAQTPQQSQQSNQPSQDKAESFSSGSSFSKESKYRAGGYVPHSNIGFGSPRPSQTWAQSPRQSNGVPQQMAQYVQPQYAAQPDPYAMQQDAYAMQHDPYAYQHEPYTQYASQAPPTHYRSSYSPRGSRSSSPRSRASSSDAKSKKRSKSISGVKDQLSKVKGQERGLAAGALGALGGGIIASKLSDNSFGTLLGATVGGIGLRHLEKKASHKVSKAAEDEGDAEKEPPRRSKSVNGRAHDALEYDDYDNYYSYGGYPGPHAYYGNSGYSQYNSYDSHAGVPNYGYDGAQERRGRRGNRGDGYESM